MKYKIIKAGLLLWTGIAIVMLVFILKPYVAAAGNENAIYFAWSLVITSFIWSIICCIKAANVLTGK